MVAVGVNTVDGPWTTYSRLGTSPPLRLRGPRCELPFFASYAPILKPCRPAASRPPTRLRPTHAAAVTADNLYEAVALALRDLQSSGLVPVAARLGDTRINVRVFASADAEHRILLE